MKSKSVFFMIMSSAFIALLVLTLHMYKVNVELEQRILNMAAQDSVSTYYEKFLNSQTSLIIASKENFIALKSQDSLINELQKTVKNLKNQLKKGSSVTKVITKTNTITKVETKVDTINKYIAYRSKFNLDNWVKGNILARKDTTLINLSIINQYDVILGYKRKHFYSPKKPYVKVVNRNPYTKVEQIKSFQVLEREKRKIVIGPTLTVGVSSNLRIQGIIGIGITYPLLEF